MSVPLDGSDAAAQVRLHEMAHVRWTPATAVGTDGIPWTTVNAVEDARIHKRLHEAGFGPRLQSRVTDDRHETAWRDPRMTALDYARLWFAAVGTGDEATVCDVLDDVGAGWVAAAAAGIHARHLGPRRPAWRRTVECALEVEATFAGAPVQLDVPHLGGYVPGCRDTVGRWGTMTVEYPALTERMPAGMLAPHRRATDTGAVPRNWSRLTSDGRVFSRRRKRPGGGTVLIDQSGSMNLTPDDVLSLMVAFPGVTIATYCGQGRRGTLRVVASNGRRVPVDDLYARHGGNVVDGPALEWLAAQPGPRTWVCDGYVTGTSDQYHDNLAAEAALTADRANVTRVDTVDEILGRGEYQS